MRSFLVATAAAASLFSSPAFPQQPNQGTGSLPDFSGVWGHPYVPAFEPPESGPAPVVNKSRRRGHPSGKSGRVPSTPKAERQGDAP